MNGFEQVCPKEVWALLWLWSFSSSWSYQGCSKWRWPQRACVRLHQCKHYHGKQLFTVSFILHPSVLKATFKCWTDFLLTFLAWIWNQVQQLKAQKELHRHTRLSAEHGEWLLAHGVSRELPSDRHDYERSGERKGIWNIFLIKHFKVVAHFRLTRLRIE